MLQPDSRVVLLDQLRPPPGYRLHGGVATTFTLQFEAALVAPLAFGSLGLRSMTDPISALEAVRSNADRLDIFCQAGQIVIPSTVPDLVAFLEPMVHPVTTKRGLFHPKIWFLQFVAEGLPDRFRLLCGSRNLVSSRAWDAIVTLEGEAVRARQSVNKPLTAFLRALPGLALNPLAAERSERIGTLATASERVHWTLPDWATDLGFHALGIGRRSPAPNFTASRRLLISPFLNDEGVRRTALQGTGECTIISSVDALDALQGSTIEQLRRRKADIFVLDPMAAYPLDEDVASSMADTKRLEELSGLHAKVTVVERNRGETHVFVGSANATSAAYDLNVEFLAELTGRAKDVGVAKMVGPDTDWRKMLQPYEPQEGHSPAADEALKALENCLRNIAAVPLEMRVAKGEADRDLILTSLSAVDVPEGYSLSLGLLTQPGKGSHHERGHISAVFSKVPIADITPFVTLTLRANANLVISTVVHARLINDPVHRLDEILARQLDTPEKFLRYLQLMLSLMDGTALGLVEESSGHEAGSWGVLGSGSGLLEALLMALAEKPEALASLDTTVDQLAKTEKGAAVMPEGFLELWASFTKARDVLAKEQQA